jgi:RecA/RadA recombinase
MARITKKEVEKIKQDVKSNWVDDDSRVEFLHSGSIMHNLAASCKGILGGWARGRINNPVGDGSSGKTLMVIEAFFHAFKNIKNKVSKIYPKVKKLILVYNNREGVMDFPLEKMYGRDFVRAIEWIFTPTIEEFGADFGRRVKNLQPGECLIYCIDSWDSLTSEASKEIFDQAADGKEKETGSYGTEKAAYASKKFFNNICDMMQGKDATLFVISQTRTKINVSFGEKKYRSGGDALNFYSHQVPWLAVYEKLKRTYRGEERVYGIRMLANFKRNKTAKPYRQAETVILFDYGVDNITSMINWYWGPKTQKITFDGAEFSREKLIQYIEENDLEDVLADMCEKEWLEIESEMLPHDRKSRF